MSSLLANAELLPVLREDLQLLRGPTSVEGSPSWTIFDPVRNSYFRIGWAAFQMLSRWQQREPKKLLDCLSRETTCKAGAHDLQELIRFLYSNSLTRDSAHGSNNDYHNRYLATRPHWLIWFFRNYLFLKIPLLRPTRFLQALLPWMQPVFTRGFRNLVLMLGLLGVFLVSRQWDSFSNTFLYFFSLKGLLFYLLALVLVKMAHELGHALTAIRYGCKIPSMGVALLVLYPVLYTDTTDAYRLPSRRQRLYIGAAGMLTEFYLALLCLLLWAVLPDGVLRSTVFVIASVNVFLTFLVNLNPFMRFDGYYILSDWLGIPNLQNRSFALAKWKLRELLFGLDESAPEYFPVEVSRLLILYAWATWIYRLVLLTAIALLVYTLFFKFLGIILFLAEIAFFIALPVLTEVRVWWAKRQQILSSRRSQLTGAVFLVVLLLFFFPWYARVTFPGIMVPENKAVVISPTAGRIDEVLVNPGDRVSAGQVLLRLTSPAIVNELARTRNRVELVELRLRRVAANREELVEGHVLFRQLKELESRLAGLREVSERLTLRSPIAGIVVDLAPSLHAGRWINEELELAMVIEPETAIIEAAVYENDLDGLSLDQAGKFFPEDAERASLAVTVQAIEGANVTQLEDMYLASVYGGAVAVRRDSAGKLIPETSIYRVRLQLDQEGTRVAEQVVRGTVAIKTRRKSFASRLYDFIAAAVIRGSGF